MKSNSFFKKQIILLIVCSVLATAMLVVGLIDFKMAWLKIVLCLLIAGTFCFALYKKVFTKANEKNK